MSRSRLVAIAVTGVAAVVIASWFTLWLRATPAQIARADYALTYVAGTEFRNGHGAEVYDPAEQRRQGAAVGLDGAQFIGDHFVNPPLTAVAAAPFTLLPLDASFRLWSLAQLGLVVAAVALAVRTAPWPSSTPRSARVMAGVVGVAGVGTAVLVLQGQVDGVSVLGLSLAYTCWRSDRRATTGVVLAVCMLLAKPHLALVLAAWLLGRRDRRLLAGAAAGVLALAVATFIAVGTAGLLDALRAPGLVTTVTPVRMLLGFVGLSASWLGGVPIAYGLAGAAMLMAVVAGFRLGTWTRRDAGSLEISLSCATVLSLLAAPHMLTQDLTVLSVPLVWCLARAAGADLSAAWPGPRTLALLGGWALLDRAARVDVGNYSAAPPGRLVPVVLIVGLLAAGSLALMQRRRRTAARLARPSVAVR